MIRLPLKFQILVAPTLIIVLLIALIGFTLAQLLDIRAENESVREWTRIVERVGSAVQGAVNLDQLAGYIDWTRRTDPNNTDALQDFHFRYLDQYQQVVDDLSYAELQARLSEETRGFLDERQAEIAYREPLDTDQARIALAELIPRLDSMQSSFMAQKRYAYTEYYRHVNAITNRMGVVALAVLGLCVVVGVAASLWSLRVTRARLRRVAEAAGAACDLRDGEPSLGWRRDELDELASCVQSMTRRLVDTVGATKLLEGAEDERRRIAMDMHDQTLADITGLMRELRAVRAQPLPAQTAARLEGLEQGLEELATGIRRVIDDLHPQTLEMLGLEAALRSYLQKRLAGEGRPSFFLRVEPALEGRLGDFERLTLYRIVTEAAHNVVRHAQATRYEIDVRAVDGELVLSVEDNGVGMEVASAAAKGGRGLGQIAERARAIGCSVEWGASRFTSGTRLTVRLPLGAPAQRHAGRPAGRAHG